MVDQEYINPFIHVHSKVKAFKDRLREVNKGDAELRENRAMRETKEIVAQDHSSSGKTGNASALRDSA